MQKIILFLLVCISFVSSKSLNFQEEKYIYAIDKVVIKSGIITYDEESIEIKYLKPKIKSLRYRDNKLIVEKNGWKKSISLNKKPEIKYFFLILKAFYEEDELFLKSLFNVEKRDNFTIYLPKTKNNREIKSIIFKKNTYLKIEKNSGDKLEIKIITESVL